MHATSRLVTVVVLAFLGATGAAAQGDSFGALRGAVVDRDFGTPIAGAKVTILPASPSAVTGPDGTFVLDRVPAGKHTLSVVKAGYERLLLTDVVVAAGRVAEVRAELAAEIVDLEEMVVTGEDFLADTEVGLLDIRAESLVLQDAISADMISKAGATDAAGALKLVVGASVVGGKYATVRGLSDRYTGTTLNGVRVPSPDPRKRAVQVDLFPTGTLESVTVSKTFTPDLQGDFTGGGVDIKTKSIPEERLLKVAVSGEYNSLATGNDRFLTYKGGGVGTWGFAGSERDLPDVAKEPQPTPPKAKRVTQNVPPAETEAAELIDAQTDAFVPVMGVSRESSGPGSGFSIVAGNRADLSESSVVGWIAALTHTRKTDFFENGINRTTLVSLQGGPPAPYNRRDYTDSSGFEEVLTGAVASFEWQGGDAHRLTARVVANHGAEDEGRLQVERGDTYLQNQSLKFAERYLVSPQVQGHHVFERSATPQAGSAGFGNPTLDWLVSSNSTRQYEPDVRYFFNEFDPDQGTAYRPANTTDADRWKRIWRDIHERNDQAGVDATFPFTQWTGTEGRVKAGAYVERGTREFTQHTFTYVWTSFQLSPPAGAPPEHRLAWEENKRYGSNFTIAVDCANGACGPDQLWTDVFLEPQRVGLATNVPYAVNQLLWTISPLTTDVDYDGDQDIDALYAMGDLPLAATVRVIGGARWERTAIRVLPNSRYGDEVLIIATDPDGNRAFRPVPEAEAGADIREAFFLPSLGVVWEPRPRMNVRAAWSRTIARPTFRELAPIATEEYLDGDAFVGNKDVRISQITNYDLRWEWFRRPGEVLAASVFSKTLRDPIEYISFNVASGPPYINPLNYERGTVRGFELEARAGLDQVWSALQGLTVGANYTYLDSSVDVPASEQESLSAYGLATATRRLQGQPDSIFNLNATYENERTGSSAGIFYTVVGETLLAGAARGSVDGVPNVIDGVAKSLDATFSQKLRHGVILGFKARNLLKDDARTFYEIPGGGDLTKTERAKAVVLGVSLGWSW